MGEATQTTLWRHRDFGLLWAGETVSQVGTMVSQLAVPLLAVTVLAATPAQMGLLTASETAAFLLVGLPAGAWLDRVRRRPVMVAADLARVLLLVSVPVAWWLGVLTLAQLVLVTLLAGVATVFFDVGYQSFLPVLIGRERLVEGNAKLEASQAAARVGGPALAGGLVQLVGAATAVTADAASYLVSALLLAGIHTHETPPQRAGRRPLRAEVAEGLGYVLRHPLLRPITACTGTANLFSGVWFALVTLFLARQLGLPAGIIGGLFAISSVGGVMGALTASAISRRLGQGRAVLLSLLLTAPITLLAPAAAPGPRLVMFAVGVFALSFGSVVYNVAQVSFRQAVCPDRLLGRMNATVRFLVWGTIPLGGLLGGGLGELLGVRRALFVAVAGMALAPGWLLASPLRRLHDLPTGAPAS